MVIALGMLPLFHGLDLSINSDKHIKPIPEKEPVDLDILTSINLTPTYEDEETAMVKYVKVNFDTMVIFEGDTVGLTATGVDVSPEIIAIYLFITEPYFDLTNLSGDNLGREINSAKAFNQVIELFPTDDPPFHKRLEVPFLQAYQDVTIHGVWVVSSDRYGHMVNDKPILRVHPLTDKLIAETNKALLEQITETQLSTQEQQKSNDIILGLTLIGLAAIPILVGTDILLRIYLRVKKEN